jgi:hypothetical protein
MSFYLVGGILMRTPFSMKSKTEPKAVAPSGGNGGRLAPCCSRLLFNAAERAMWEGLTRGE